MKGKHISQERLAVGLKKGTTEELKYLYTHVKPKVKAYIAVQKGGLDCNVNDIFQIALIKIRQQLLDNKLSIDNLENYIFRVCKHEFLKLNNLSRIENIDRTAYRSQAPYAADTDVLDKELAKEEELNLYFKAFQMLKPECQKLFKLSSEGFQDKEIAQLLDTTEKFIKTKRSRCKKYFAKMIAKIKENE